MRLRWMCLTGIVTAASLFMGCAQKSESKRMTVVLRMMPGQERFFRTEIVAPFEKQNKCKIDIATFVNEWDLPNLLKLDAEKKNPSIALVKTPFEMTRVLAGSGLLKPLTSIHDTEVVNHDLAEYHQLAAGLGYYHNVPYYIPRKLETRILFYRKSKVTDAISKFEQHKERIQKTLKKYNGYGLPAGYTLESDPSQWDFYDVYVVGSIWANEPYNNVRMGRIAHRGARYAGTALDIVDKSIQLGATSKDILQLNSDKVVDALLWERILVRDNIYNSGMWQDPWKGSNIYNAIKDGKVYMATIQQIDAFLIHGWPEDPSMATYLPDQNDMGLTVAPKAVSFELDNSGKPKYEGTQKFSTGGWWWGIPASAPDPSLAYKFARYITSHEVQAKECARFGMIPVRKDILNKIPEVFDQGWVGDIFKVSVNQVQINELTTVPLVKGYPEVAQNIIDAWYKLAVEYKESESDMMDFNKMKSRLSSDFIDKQKQILGTDYPVNQ